MKNYFVITSLQTLCMVKFWFSGYVANQIVKCFKIYYLKKEKRYQIDFFSYR